MTAAEQCHPRIYSRTDGGDNATIRPRRRFVSALLISVALIASVVAGVAPAGAAMSRSELLLAAEMFGQLNNERAARGLPDLVPDLSMNTATRRLSEELEDAGYLYHSDDGRAEVVAYGWNTGQITDAWMRSAGHRHLITDPNLVPASMSISCDADGRMWAVVQFRRLDTRLGTQSSSPTSPIATPSTDGSSCEHPPNGLSQESLNAIKRLYRAYFWRDADSGGLEFWRNQAAAGQSIWSISEYFESAPEFVDRYGDLTNSEFIDLVYRNVMQRSADASGERYWLDRIRNGTTRGELMVYFSDSPEYRARTGIN